jgi:hypothetical protein
MTLITSQKLGDIETGIKTAAESISFVQASDSNLATTTLQESLNILIRNSNAVSTTGAVVGGEANNAAISGTIPAPGTGKAIFLKSLTFSYSSNPASVRILSIASGGIELVKFGVTAGGAGFVPVSVPAPANTAVTYTLPASGAAGVTSLLRIYYSTVDVIA